MDLPPIRLPAAVLQEVLSALQEPGASVAGTARRLRVARNTVYKVRRWMLAKRRGDDGKTGRDDEG
jgi:transposase-like protein